MKTTTIIANTMSNSPDDPRLIPGHPEFVQRPATWEKTVAKQICEISRLTHERDELRGKLDFYEQYDHDTAQCAAEAWHDLATFEGEDADAQLIIERAIQRVVGPFKSELSIARAQPQPDPPTKDDMKYTLTFTDSRGVVRHFKKPMARTAVMNTLPRLLRKAPTKGFPATIITLVSTL